jgi:hypothetical protein
MIMYKALALSLALGAGAMAAHPSHGSAAERAAQAPMVKSVGSAKQTDGRYYRRRAAQPRQFAGRRVGFYSYTYRDVINTYGMSRSLYGSINTYRDPYVDRQTPAGPFDHGFFFDSGILPRGGDSPYIR